MNDLLAAAAGPPLPGLSPDHSHSTSHDDEARQAESSPVPDSAGYRNSPGRFTRSFFRAANLQDKLLEKLVARMIPGLDGLPGSAVAGGGSGGSGSGSGPGRPDDAAHGAADDLAFTERPNFAMATMSNNFRRFNARIGVVFKFQVRVTRLLQWRRPSQTLSLLAVYTFICLDPYLLFALPLVIALFGILIPSFVARHPAAPSAAAASLPPSALSGDHPDRPSSDYYQPRGPPLAPARTVRPVKELSRDFFRNMRDLQNCMDDFSNAHDQVVALVVPATNFSDEALSSALFVMLVAAALVMFIAAHLLPWRLLALAAGWTALGANHPALARLVHRAKQQQEQQQQEQPQPGGETGSKPSGSADGPDGSSAGTTSSISSKLAHARAGFDAWVRSDIILDEAPETREVEIFELQRLCSPTDEWEPWLFTPSPYDPLSAARISGDRPRGCRFFEDVAAPPGWEWSEKKWALDLWSREWVEERIITGVEVETEGERWVYDMLNEWENRRKQEQQEQLLGMGASSDVFGGSGLFDDVPLPPMRSTGSAVPPPHFARAGAGPALSWEEGEEGEEGVGRRGEWRRRRWVRMVRRKSCDEVES